MGVQFPTLAQGLSRLTASARWEASRGPEWSLLARSASQKGRRPRAQSCLLSPLVLTQAQVGPMVGLPEPTVLIAGQAST